MSDKLHDEIADLAAIEQVVAEHLAMVRRRKGVLKKHLVESGEELRLVTDHALLRFMERHKGIDVDSFRSELRKLADEAQPAKDGEHHWHASGVIMIIGSEGQVITVLSQEQAEKWDGRKLKNGARIAASEGVANG